MFLRWIRDDDGLSMHCKIGTVTLEEGLLAIV